MQKLHRLLQILLALAGAVVLVVAALLVHGYGIVHKSMGNPVPTLVVAPDTSLIARGRHIVEIVCSSCHAAGDDAAVLSGGTRNQIYIPGGPQLGVIYAPNITPGGVIRGASDGMLSRAIREGVGREGSPLLVMPSPHYHAMSDRDLAAVISCLRSQPAVRNVVPKRRLTPLAYVMLGLNPSETSALLPVPGPIEAPAEAPDSTYGAYLTPILGCSVCHGADYGGGRRGQLTPLGPDLVGLAKAGSFEAFKRALRHGLRSSGAALDPTLMPWPVYSRLTDLEARAVYIFLRGQPGR